MISCADFMAALGDYMDGEVAVEVRLQLEAHLSRCQTCQVVYDSAQKTIRVLTESGCFNLPEAVSGPIAESVMARIRSERRDS